MDSYFTVRAHQCGDLAVYEIENCVEKQGSADFVSFALSQFSIARTYEELFETIVAGIKHFTGYDRIMVYQFADDGSGEVIAELCEDDMEPFLGLRYPASDVPQQARELYKRNLVRCITDVNQESFPIYSTRSETIDLSMARCRAVSPVHIKYLQNMGVTATVGLSLVVEGELWGMIMGHNNTPKPINNIMLEHLELASELCSMELARRLSNEKHALSSAANNVYAQIVSTINTEKPVVEALIDQYDMVKSLIDMDGIFCVVNGVSSSVGEVPDTKISEQLIEYAERNQPSSIFSVQSLEKLDSGLANPHAAGAMCIPISREPKDYIVLYRRSQLQVVRWAGNPTKTVESSGVLNPRASFSEWLSAHDDLCANWSVADESHASAVRIGVMEITIRHLHEKEHIQKEAKSRLELLIGELNHRVRNILSLVNAIVSQTSQDKLDVESFAESISARITALALGHDQLTQSSWRRVSFETLLQTEIQAYRVKSDVFELEGPLLYVDAYAVTPLVLVFHELITNAAKYGALSRSKEGGKVLIKWCQNEALDCVISWQEMGGPVVSETNTDSFGMMVIRSVIPHELKGQARLDFHPSGLQGTFVIPARYMSSEQPIKSHMSSDNITPPNSMHSVNETVEDNRQYAVIVEDNLIIALDLEKKMKRMGFAMTKIFGDTTTARNSIAKKRPDIAILDMNLGTETTMELAQWLTAESIPFVFATGFGSHIDLLPQSLLNTPILTKPVNEDALERAVDMSLHNE
jgi:light-regulated signal transduction histidine kinase (bacteriophytochrome)/CheY-like chemotaxis protein